MAVVRGNYGPELFAEIVEKLPSDSEQAVHLVLLLAASVCCSAGVGDDNATEAFACALARCREAQAAKQQAAR